MVPAAVAALILAFPVSTSREDPDRFLAALRSHCGKAYVGRVIDPQPADTAFVRQRLVMHVRGCGDTVRIPFHVGDDRSRTWVFTRTSGGVRLKHDHRHQDGSADRITQYGGDSRATGTAERMEFAADSLTAALIPAARTNVWTVEITSTQFVYQLRREGTDRRFRVEFDLSRPVAPPPAPWGERGTIIGVVVDSATQRPMSRSLICLHESNRRTMNCARTDIAGSFRLESIPPGTSDIDVTCASERGLGGLRKLRQPYQSRAAVDSLRLVVSAEGCDTRPLRRISRLFSGFYSSGFEQSQFTPCKADGWYIPSDTATLRPLMRGAWVSWPRGRSIPGIPNPWPEGRPSYPPWNYPEYFVRWYGVVEGPGSYGHLGGAAFEFTVDSIVEVRTPGRDDCSTLRK